MITIIFLIGLILPKTPLGVSTLNTLSAFSILLFFCLLLNTRVFGNYIKNKYIKLYNKYS